MFRCHYVQRIYCKPVTDLTGTVLNFLTCVELDYIVQKKKTQNYLSHLQQKAWSDDRTIHIRYWKQFWILDKINLHSYTSEGDSQLGHPHYCTHISSFFTYLHTWVRVMFCDVLCFFYKTFFYHLTRLPSATFTLYTSQCHILSQLSALSLKLLSLSLKPVS